MGRRSLCARILIAVYRVQLSHQHQYVCDVATVNSSPEKYELYNCDWSKMRKTTVVRACAVSFVTCLVCSLFADGAGAHVQGHAISSNHRPAQIVGHLVVGGGPPSPRTDLVRISPTAGTVIVRDLEGRIVTKVHSKLRGGFRVRIAPGRYMLTALDTLGHPSECQPATVVVKPHSVMHVVLAFGCLAP